MTLLSEPVNGTPLFPLGHRRSISSTPRCVFDLAWGNKEVDSEATARSRAYPSPPMSGSPPLPLRATQEAGSRGEAPSLYATSRSQDGFFGSQVQLPPTNLRDQPQTAPPMSRSYPQEPPAGATYSYPRADEPSRLNPYSLQNPHRIAQGISHQHQTYLSAAGPSSAETYPILSRPPVIENPPYTSPKSQRKTKGHVASACVPCKRAHLRCDAQRPCSRCLGNGKEDACIDVQHKKRGRPRLRDERDARFDPTRFPHPQDVALRRPLSIYPSGSPGPVPYDDPLRRSQSFRSLESQPGEAIRSFQERPDSSMYNSPFPTTSRPPEPMAYLSMEFEIVKASSMFMDVIRASNLAGRKFSDVITPPQASLVYALQSQLFNEQRSKEPNYLPPILGRVDQVIQELGFTGEDAARFHLDRQEYLGFVGSDGYTRTLPLRFGLAKQGSFYFVVIMLNLQQQHPQHPQHPPPSQHGRDTIAYHQQPATPQSMFMDHAPASTTFDPRRHQLSDGSVRPPLGHPTSSPGMNSGTPSYALPNRLEYPGPPTYQAPRSEPLPTSRPPTQHSYQLPPIRAQSDQRPPSREPGWPRDERSGRVDIGGLIEKPDTSRRQ